MTAHPEPERRKRLTGAQREAQLLDVAEKLFQQHGYDGVTIEDIAREAGVSRAIVYRHHGSKEAAFIACVRRARSTYEDNLARVLSRQSRDWNTAIREGGAVYFDLIEQDPAWWNLLFTSSATLDSAMAQQLSGLRTQTMDAVAALLKPFAPDADNVAFNALVWVISGISEQLGRWWLTRPEVSREELLELFVGSVSGAAAEMLRTRPTKQSPTRR